MRCKGCESSTENALFSVRHAGFCSNQCRIKMLETENAQLENQTEKDWFDAEIEIPKRPGRYIGFAKIGEKFHVTELEFHGNEFMHEWRYQGKAVVVYCSHWKELPKPPK